MFLKKVNRMKKDNYFTEIKGIGNLDIDEIICEYDFPVLFTLKNSKSDNRYIAVCCEIVEEQRWVISPISVNNIINLLTDKIDIYSSFITNPKAECIIAHWSKSKKVTTYDYIKCSDIPESDLPLKGEYLEAEEGEFEEYIDKLKNNVIFEIDNKMDILQIKIKNYSVSYSINNYSNNLSKSFLICNYVNEQKIYNVFYNQLQAFIKTNIFLKNEFNIKNMPVCIEIY